MATVIRNPMVLHCLQQFGITPAEARAIDASQSIETEAQDQAYVALADRLVAAERDLRNVLHAAK